METNAAREHRSPIFGRPWSNLQKCSNAIYSNQTWVLPTIYLRPPVFFVRNWRTLSHSERPSLTRDFGVTVVLIRIGTPRSPAGNGRHGPVVPPHLGQRPALVVAVPVVRQEGPVGEQGDLGIVTFVPNVRVPVDARVVVAGVRIFHPEEPAQRPHQVPLCLVGCVNLPYLLDGVLVELILRLHGQDVDLQVLQALVLGQHKVGPYFRELLLPEFLQHVDQEAVVPPYVRVVRVGARKGATDSNTGAGGETIRIQEPGITFRAGGHPFRHRAIDAHSSPGIGGRDQAVGTGSGDTGKKQSGTPRGQ
ncbi:hypothetical protein PGQ11_006141 [Apiospora arundinis]|uniref:Uncharacterized protein n=1 Tax=Apiospora arundinis TaxID=335852 RepID=A0ABR2IST0_9PEZI